MLFNGKMEREERARDGCAATRRLWGSQVRNTTEFVCRMAPVNLLAEQICDRLFQHGFRHAAQIFAGDQVVVVVLSVEGDLEIALLATKSMLGALSSEMNAISAAAPRTGLVALGVSSFREMKPIGWRSRGLHTVGPFTLRKCGGGVYAGWALAKL